MSPCPWAAGRPPEGLEPRNVIVSGTRAFTDKKVVWSALDRLTFWIPYPRVIVGDAKGVDALAFAWAEHNWWPRSEFKADWYGHGRAAGPIRNREMLKYAGPRAFLIAVWDGASPGTADMLAQAEKVLKPSRIRIIKV